MPIAVILDRMRPKLPQLFGRLPKALLVVMPVPAYSEKDQRQPTTNTARPMVPARHGLCQHLSV